ncbi:nucleoside phosphorylase [Lagierella sp. ICN-221743]
MIIDSYDKDTESVISLKDFFGERKYITEKCLIIFSKSILEYLLDNFECQEIGNIESVNGSRPVYKSSFEGQEFAFYLSIIGSALSSTDCVVVNWITGSNKFIMFGSCGSLDKEKTFGKYIIPTEAYRGEGASYYYKAPSDYLDIKNHDKVEEFFIREKAPYTKGKVWTTDVMLRETRGLVSKRKSEGCIAVEMELAGVQAACDFYGLELYNFLEAGDVLNEGSYEVEGLQSANHNLGKLYLALKFLKEI